MFEPLGKLFAKLRMMLAQAQAGLQKPLFAAALVAAALVEAGKHFVLFGLFFYGVGELNFATHAFLAFFEVTKHIDG